MANTHSLVLDSSLKQCAFALDSVAFSLTGDIAWSGWIKFSSLTGAQIIMSKDHGALSKTSYNFYKGSSGKLAVSVSDNGTYDALHYIGFSTDSAVITDADKWYFCAFSFDISAETCAIFVGDVSTAPTSQAVSKAIGTTIGDTLYDGDTQFVIGAWKQDDACYVAGKVNDCSLWSVTKTEANFQSSYKTIVTSDTGLVGTWFVSNTTVDQSGNGNNLTLYHGTGSTDPTYDNADVPFTIAGSSPSSSFSASISISISASVSASVSSSSSTSLSNSASASVSNSASSSASASPYADEVFTRGDYNVLPTDDTDLEVTFTGQEQRDVRYDDNTYVRQSSTDEYAIFQFKNQNDNNTDKITVSWRGKSSKSCAVSKMYLQVYNRNSATWEVVDSDETTGAESEFELTGIIDTNLSYYYDASYWVAFRVYQEAI